MARLSKGRLTPTAVRYQEKTPLFPLSNRFRREHV